MHAQMHISECGCVRHALQASASCRKLRLSKAGPITSLVIVGVHGKGSHSTAYKVHTSIIQSNGLLDRLSCLILSCLLFPFLFPQHHLLLPDSTTTWPNHLSRVRYGKQDFGITMRSFLYSSCIVFGSLARLAQSGLCYDFYGVPWGNDYQPCNASAPVSACCRLNMTGVNPPVSPQVCMADGLCMATLGGPSPGTLFASGCTDRTGTDPACPHICTPRPCKYSCIRTIEVES
ncbi:hypothetical protein M8818_003792 [Zalaria obscura]|uniref:Uncharacterized protein n=1 Tax=Zalaria obscura TaxID=2024903 RepID=A0ACC3SDV9_9PEZI